MPAESKERKPKDSLSGVYLGGVRNLRRLSGLKFSLAAIVTETE